MSSGRCLLLMNTLTSPDALKLHFRGISVLCGLSTSMESELRVQTFQPDLGRVKLSPLPHLVVHLLINTNLIVIWFISVFICKNILNSSLSWSKSSETNPWYRLFSASHGFTRHFLFLQKQPPEMFCKKTCSLLKKRSWYGCFSVNSAKFIKDTFFTEHLWASASVSCVWSSSMFPVMFYKLRTWSDNVKSVNFLSKCLLVTCDTVHFMLFASTLLIISFGVLFLNMNLGVLFYKKIKWNKKIFIENQKEYGKL